MCCLLVHTNVNVEAAHDKGGAVLEATKVEGVAVFQDGVRTWCRSCVRLQVAAGAQRDIAARIRALSHSRAVLHLPRSRVLWTSVPTVDLSCSSHLFGLKACMHACTADTDLRVAAMLSHMPCCTVLPVCTESNTSAHERDAFAYPNEGWTRMLHFWLRPSVNRRAGSRTWSEPHMSSIAHTGPGLGLGWCMRRGGGGGGGGGVPSLFVF